MPRRQSHPLLGKGAPDQLLARAANALTAEGKLESVDSVHDRYLAYNTQLGEKGLRVMALARRDFPTDTFDRSAADFLPLVSDLTLLALVGIVDPPRAEAAAAIEECHRAGIQVAMVTGDHALTARAVGAEVGFAQGRSQAPRSGRCPTRSWARQPPTCASTPASPRAQVRIVDALKRRGHIVAMTGDGVNDAPALKRADIGVAMGLTGPTSADEAADMVLADDNFATIVKAVKPGRACSTTCASSSSSRWRVCSRSSSSFWVRRCSTL